MGSLNLSHNGCSFVVAGELSQMQYRKSTRKTGFVSHYRNMSNKLKCEFNTDLF